MTWTSRSGTEIRDLVPSEARRRWVRDGHCPGRDLYTLFRARVDAHPRREAVIDDERTLDYAALDREVRRIASALTAAGVRDRDIVGIRLPNGWRAVVTELAVAAIGAVALPYPAGRGIRDTAALLGKSRAAAAVFGSTSDADGTTCLPDLRVVRTFGAGEDGPRSLDTAPAGAWQPPAIDPEAPVRILVTSGSEAEPKMIAYSHDAMAGGRANYVRALHDGSDPVRALMMMPLSSSYGSCATHVSIAALGSTLVLMERFDPVAALRLVREHRPTHLFGVPTMLRRLAEHPPGPDEDNTCLRTVVSSSAPLSEVTADACARRLRARVISVYGSSDGINCHTARTGLDGSAGLPDPAVAQLRIIAPDGRPLPPGEPGEICARGPMTPLSYVAAPDLDARYRTRDGWVRSGDRGVLDGQGRLHVLGRLKQVVVRGGHNISPAEVELEIRAHPAIVDVACVAVPDDDLGERLCACVSLAAGSAELQLPALTAFLQARGLERRKLPEALVVLPELPLAPTGKVCRRTVTAIAVHRAVPVP
ncbi:acyl--CoA ligase [Saccharopolyspora sp. HNM0986]|uniref:class I adenylate-forming enzyme family protein n=1 Tax=Saccharopolyspora galaxeae TaxID=2781241 RepID=UPI0027DB968E|nr:class I adenylate-forming enzyme family protein [Saccharopolyspora sp. HNM0986]MBK0869242.1 acyl--CoA ligase [Saccharopolyspora sp. HNM0986]